MDQQLAQESKDSGLTIDDVAKSIECLAGISSTMWNQYLIELQKPAASLAPILQAAGISLNPPDA